ncbi:hypothetical protein FisN_15Lh109 [Fistulifera solaris]|uniref:Uncharacterized protein n=1 Tax=Fistulifera solaris TaxID=1519565 RepID=A0A1Z5KBD2_FISSO|nr:hypothetical protein FisN_15Lh109 [Fistulifera solaris]|eukprot:GAX23391.1 hypothetical protein FisN_15Lh109 [Fistulifera solaris]
MITKSFFTLVHLVFYDANAFTTIRTPKTSIILFEGRNSFLPDLSDLAKPLNGFFGPSRTDDSTASSPVTFTSTPEGLVLQAKRVLNSDLGLLDPSLLDDEKFQWVSPTVDKPLDKTDYLAAGRFFDLRAAFPDLNYRAHDFRIDIDDDATVRCTCRITGTMRGALRLRDVILSPTGKTMICPPEGFSMTFDLESGKLVKLCTGFAMDRLVGNTQGTTGVVAAAITGGQPISDWDIYPPATVLKRFFGRPVKPLPEVSNFLAPFPETVMIQLAKGIIGSNMASVDPSLLAQSFTYMTPSLGPIGKEEFLENFAKEEFQDVDPRISNYRVDPYDPERVWVDLKPVGTGYQGTPQAMSFTFDGDGFCTRITAGAVLDPTIGNGGGLGGPEGLKYARGQASNPLTTRPLPRLLARIKKDALAPLSGVAQKASTVQTVISIPNSAEPPRAKRTPAAPQEKQLTPLEKLSASVGGSINLSNLVKEEKAPSPAVKSSSPPVSKSVKQQSPPSSIKPPPPKSPPQAVRPTPPPPPKNTTPFPTKSLTLPLGSINIRTPPTPSSPSKGASSIAKNAADKAAQAKQEQKRKEAAEAAKKQSLAKAAEQAARKKEEARKAEATRIEMEQKKEATRRASEAKAKQEQAKRDQEAARERLVADGKAKAEATKRAMEQQKQAEALQKKKAAAIKEMEEKRRKVESLTSLNKATSRATISLFGRQETTALTSPKRDSQPSRSVEVDQQRRDSEKDQKEREEAALAMLAKAASRATINLLGLKNLDNEPSKSPQKKKELPATLPKRPASTSKAPAGVPTLSRWRENADGSVTGNVSGSRNFTDGEKITTSKIVRGTFASGEIVVTGSGSKYYLN